MIDLLFGPVAVWFGVPAVIGTAFFTGRMALMLLGGHADADMDVGADVDLGADVDVGADAHGGGHVDSAAHTGESDSTAAFKVLSIQAMAAFLMGFGWGGLGALRGSGWSIGVSVGVAIAAGVAMMWFLGMLLRFVYGFQSSGNVPIYQALEAEGSVYAQIPPAGEGRGEVRVLIGDRERYYRAISDGGAIPTGSKVRVVSVNDDDNSVTVTEA